MKAPPGGTARRAEIISVAARLFDEHGYHSTTMDDIAAAMGIRKPTLYHHVQSKTQIVVWIHDELVNELTDRLEARLAAEMPRPALLHLVLEDILEILETRPGHLRVYFEHHRELQGEEGELARAKRDRYTDLVRSVIAQGHAAGEFHAPDPMLSTFAFFGMSNWAYQWYQPGGALGHREIALYLWKTYMNGVAVGPVAAPVHPADPAAPGPAAALSRSDVPG
ncbi:TetR/AcrR family transcriptional regulator [Pseudonocardia xishanensis]|uniref:TetR/AcrR family transcriptional regulator n=1 Tax=Pseudonocardia xishanensis TaxID=630995 RepID=UPI0031EE10F9